MHVHIIWIALISLLVPVFAQSEYKPLPETYVSEDEKLTLRYPTGWVAYKGQTEIIFVATNREIDTLNNQTIPLGEAGLGIVISNPDDEFLREFFSGDDPLSVLENIVKISTATTAASNLDIEYNAPIATTFADFSAARTDALIMGNHIFLIVTEPEENVYMMLAGIVAASNFAKFEPKLLAIAESIRFQPSND